MVIVYHVTKPSWNRFKLVDINLPEAMFVSKWMGGGFLTNVYHVYQAQKARAAMMALYIARPLAPPSFLANCLSLLQYITILNNLC